MTLEPVYVGVDVAKEHLDAHVPGGKGWRMPNSPRGAEALLRRALGSTRAPVHVCCESTGGYERVLMEACWKLSVPVSRVNAWQVRKFAESDGRLEKNDRIDARTIAEFAASRKPPADPEPPRWQRALRELWTLRSALVRDRTAARSRLEHLSTEAARAEAEAHLDELARRVERVEKLAGDVVAESKEAAGLFARYTAIKSVGRATALAVLAEAPDLAAYSAKTAAKLAGVAPLCDQSGKHDGPRHIAKGRHLLRRALYMAALVAARRNAVLAAFYRRLVDAGKPPKVAIVAVMRKLIVLLHRVASSPSFVPRPEGTQPA
jgi:transposase